MKFIIANTKAGITTYQRDFLTNAKSNKEMIIGVALYLIATNTTLKSCSLFISPK